MKIDFNDLGLTDYSERKSSADRLSVASVAKDILKSIGRHTVDFVKEIDVVSLCKTAVREKVFTSDYVSEIAKDTYLIKTDMLFNSFLFVGSERALLIDTGFGIKGLKKKVREITDKPIIAAVTHGHPGSIGGAGDFERVKIHKSDIRIAKLFSNGILHRAAFLLSPSKYFHGYGFDDLVTRKPNFSSFTKRDFRNGISLGNKTIEIISVPSHTKGSIAFVDRSTGIMVSGDIVTPLGFTLLPGACDLATYSKNLEEFMNIAENCTVFCSYLKTPLDHRKMISFKNLVNHTSYGDNDSSKLIAFAKSSEYLQFLLYYPYKTRHMSLIEKFRK